MTKTEANKCQVDKAFDAPVKILTELEIETILHKLAIEREEITSAWSTNI